MKLKTKLITIFTLFVSANLFAANTISLLESAKNKGMTLYWDSLSEFVSLPA